MSESTDYTRQLATIKSARTDNDRGSSIWVHVEGRGWGQGFGGLYLGNGEENTSALFKDYLRDLCNTFHVESLDDLAGKACYVLRCFDTWGADIEGLESVDTGQRFTHTAWRKKHFPDAPNPLERAVRRHETNIEYHNREAAREREALGTVWQRYRSWETE